MGNIRDGCQGNKECRYPGRLESGTVNKLSGLFCLTAASTPANAIEEFVVKTRPYTSKDMTLHYEASHVYPVMLIPWHYFIVLVLKPYKGVLVEEYY